MKYSSDILKNPNHKLCLQHEKMSHQKQMHIFLLIVTYDLSDN